MIVVILAAGKGTRMKSELPKVLHKAAGKPMLGYTVDLAKHLDASKTVVVIGQGAEKVRSEYENTGVIFCVQTEQRGTADAVVAAKNEFTGSDEPVLILCGDMPNIKLSTVQEFIKNAEKQPDIPSFISVKTAQPAGYGRVVRMPDNSVLSIVEEKDADEQIKKINEINTGVYYCKASTLEKRLEKIDNKNSQNEFYLTDIVKNGSYAWCAQDEKEFMGVNDRVQLSELSKIMYIERAKNFMKEGVTIIDPSLVYIEPDVTIGADTVVYPNTYLNGKTKIGKNVVIYSGVRIESSTINDNCKIKENTLIEESNVGVDSTIGPMAHLRPGSVLQGHNQIGNFVELKKANLAEGTKANHLTYLGDCTIGTKVNIGCGTITCNYDGFSKHQTVIGDNVFVGSDVQFVAPVVVGNDVIIGAGSTITSEIPDGALAVSRSKQVNYPEKAHTFRKIKQKNK